MNWQVYRKPNGDNEWTDEWAAYTGRHHCGNLGPPPKTFGKTVLLLLIWYPWLLLLPWWQAIPLAVLLMDVSVLLVKSRRVKEWPGSLLRWPGNLLILQLILGQLVIGRCTDALRSWIGYWTARRNKTL